jgi:hypothetical protein
MAVNFQRRNVGVLADIPTFEDVGRSAYVDYGAAPNAGALIAQETVAPTEEAAAAPAGPLTPEAAAEYEMRQREFLAQAEAAAERRRRAAGNPLNMIGSVLGGVIGTPFALLENAVGGGDNDLTAPFTPKQTAQDRYAATMAGISTQRLGLAQKMDGMRSSQAQALQSQLADRSKTLGEMYDIAANLAQNAKGAADPQGVYEQGIANLLQDPIYGPVARSVGVDKMPYSPDLARTFARGKDVTSRLDETGGVSFGSITENGTGVIYDKQGNVVRMVQYGDSNAGGVAPPAPTAPAPAPAVPSMENTPPPELGPNGLPSYLTPAQYSIISRELGPERTDAWIKQNNIVVEQPPAAPSQDAIDAELRRRGVIK